MDNQNTANSGTAVVGVFQNSADLHKAERQLQAAGFTVIEGGPDGDDDESLPEGTLLLTVQAAGDRAGEARRTMMACGATSIVGEATFNTEDEGQQ